MTLTIVKAFVYEKHILLNLIVNQALPSYNLTTGKTIQKVYYIVETKQTHP